MLSKASGPAPALGMLTKTWRGPALEEFTWGGDTDVHPCVTSMGSRKVSTSRAPWGENQILQLASFIPARQTR